MGNVTSVKNLSLGELPFINSNPLNFGTLNILNSILYVVIPKLCKVTQFWYYLVSYKIELSMLMTMIIV